MVRLRHHAALSALLLGAAVAGATASAAQPLRIETATGPLEVKPVAGGLEKPWSIAFLPDGQMLVTEKAGRLRIVGPDGKVSEPLSGVPAVVSAGQGGLLDVALDPDFANTRLVYMSFSEAGPNGVGTAVARGRLGERGLDNLQVVFRQKPKVAGPNHFGSRLAFAPDGRLFVTLGERFKFEPAQDLASHLGKIVRIERDGSIPADNPFVDKPGVLPEIWSWGHRNVQGAAINPATGALWAHEMGPAGGDELNIPEAGKNYGWPLVSWGRHYDGREIPKPTTRPDLAGSVRQWTPVIAPSGMSFYTGDLMPGWKGNILIGGLRAEGVVRLSLAGDAVTDEERIVLRRRIRDVKQGPDGAVYVITDAADGEILRLAPPGR
jgi:glucose/arabinose dehydrogenase